ncbi:hypothetical protein JCM21900_003055 [Sporobolomyces salmonicolor]
MAAGASPGSAGEPGGKKKSTKNERIVSCSHCEMTFKKLEHAQRHERTHTLDRPYACDTCGKTFARQDTLHRHNRLHTRADDDGPKGPKKRRASTSTSASTKPAVPPKSPKSSLPSLSAASSSSTTAQSLPQPILVHGDSSASSSSSSSAHSYPGLGLSMSLPVVPPSFPAYSQPEQLHSQPSFHLHNHANGDVNVHGHIDPSVLPLPRSFSNVSYGSRLPSRRASTGDPASTPGTSRRPMNRPRALTLAGLPESIGCFSLINSPASSPAASSPSLAGDNDNERDSSMEADEGDEKPGDSWASLDSPSFPAPPESHYPSPAFTCYSPSSLHTDTLSDLQAILDNDPIPSSAFKSSPLSSQQEHESQDEFDFEAFAASIEGPAPSVLAPAVMPSPPTIPVTLDELLTSAASSTPSLCSSTKTDGIDRYPTPPSGTVAPASLPLAYENDLDWISAFTSSVAAADAEQQAREDAAATAAMFSSGFGLGGSSSTLGLNFGLPSPPLTTQALNDPAQQPALSLPIAGAGSSSLPATASSPFSNVHTAYAAVYPTLSLSLPIPAPLPSVAPMSIPSPSASSASQSQSQANAAAAASAASMHDLLAAAWERRQRQISSAASPVLPASINLRSPFAHPSKHTPAFYIPSSSAGQPRQQQQTISASGPLSLPIPTWASIPTAKPQ